MARSNYNIPQPPKGYMLVITNRASTSGAFFVETDRLNNVPVPL